MVRRRWCSCRHGASYIRSCPISASASVALPMTVVATASPTGRSRWPPTPWITTSPTHSPSWMPMTRTGPCSSASPSSFGGLLACILAAHHPERVKAAILAGTVTSIGPGYPYMSQKHFLAEHNNWEGWNKYNREYWLTNYPDPLLAHRPWACTARSRHCSGIATTAPGPPGRLAGPGPGHTSPRSERRARPSAELAPGK
jgi:hypothetical protein